MPPITTPKMRPKRLSLGSLPFLFAEIIFGYVYFTFVVKWLTTLIAQKEITLALVEMILFHVIFGLSQTSFFMTTFTDPGEIPEGFMEPTVDELKKQQQEQEQEQQDHQHEDDELIEDNASSSTSSSTGLIVEVTERKKKKGGGRRMCSKCCRAKPDRAHHCSQCKRCTLKMDHHCPWVNNCVGFFNYKFFVLFLSWTVILAVFVAACLLDPCFQLSSSDKDQDRDPWLFVTFIMAAVFGIGLGLFVITHYAYLFMNQTTIEVMEKKTNLYVGNLYNIGAYHNFTQVFGDSPLLWLIPVYSSKGNGLTFPTRSSPSYA